MSSLATITETQPQKELANVSLVVEAEPECQLANLSHGPNPLTGANYLVERSMKRLILFRIEITY